MGVKAMRVAAASVLPGQGHFYFLSGASQSYLFLIAQNAHMYRIYGKILNDDEHQPAAVSLPRNLPLPRNFTYFISSHKGFRYRDRQD